MHFLLKVALALAANLVAILAAEYFVPGFLIANWDVKTFVILTFVLTLLNFLLKPILKLVLGPVIVLTLGLGALLVNALILGLLDFLSPALSIQGIVPLLEATLIVSAVNFFFHLTTRTP